MNTPQPVNADRIMDSMMQALKVPDQLNPNPNANNRPAQSVQQTVTAPQQAVQPQAPRQQILPVQPQTQPQMVNTSGNKSAEAAKPLVDIPSFEDPKPDEIKPDEVVQDHQEEEVDLSDLPEEPAAQNFKKLRESIKTERQLRRQLEKERDEFKSGFESYEKGEKIPEVLQAKESRIQELEKYEQIIDVQRSREYQELVVKPIRATSTEFKKLAVDYGVPEDKAHAFADQALKIDNVKDRNAFLSKYFTDEAGLMEARSHVKKLLDLGQQAIEAEKKPLELKQDLQAQFATREAEERKNRVVAFESTLKSAWHSALDKTAKEGVYKEFVMDPTNPEFNKKVVEPIQHKASIQLSALVKKLELHGLKELPQDIAEGMARMVLLAVGGAMSLNEKNKAIKEANGYRETANNLNTYFRPSIGRGNGNGQPTQAPRVPLTAEQAGIEASKFFK